MLFLAVAHPRPLPFVFPSFYFHSGSVRGGGGVLAMGHYLLWPHNPGGTRSNNVYFIGQETEAWGGAVHSTQ